MNTLNIDHDKFLFIIVGVGGTGGNFAKEFCRLASSLPKDIDIKIVFMDGDIVESKNKSRQPYGDCDISMNKAEVLAERCSAFFDIDIIANTNYLSSTEQLTSIFNEYDTHLPILCGCVDNHPARQIMDQIFNKTDNMVYLDSGNEDWYGEIVCGVKSGGEIILPARSYYFPEVLTDTSLGKEEESCEIKSKSNPQHLITNLQAAIIMLSYVSELLVMKQISGNISYFDVTKKFTRTSERVGE